MMKLFAGSQFKKLIFNLFTMLFFYGGLFAQDTIILISGAEITGKIKDTTDTDVIIEIYKDNKTKINYVDYLDIYQINYENGLSKIKYYQDSLIGNDFSAPDMGLYLSGVKDARKHYRVPFGIKVGGITSGLVGGYFLPFYGLGLLSPAIYTGFMGTIEPKLKYNKLPETKLKNNPVYLSGYKSIAAKKKMQTSVLFGLSGVIVSVVALMLIN